MTEMLQVLTMHFLLQERAPPWNVAQKWWKSVRSKLEDEGLGLDVMDMFSDSRSASFSNTSPWAWQETPLGPPSPPRTQQASGQCLPNRLFLHQFGPVHLQINSQSNIINRFLTDLPSTCTWACLNISFKDTSNVHLQRHPWQFMPNWPIPNKTQYCAKTWRKTFHNIHIQTQPYANI